MLKLPLLQILTRMSACADGYVRAAKQPRNSTSDFNRVFYYTKFGSDQISDRFTHILRIFVYHKQCYIQCSGLSELPETISTEEKTHNIWFAFTVGDSRPGLQKTSLFIQRPAARWGCRVILQTTSEGGVEEVTPPPPNPTPCPHKALGH